MIMKDLGFTIFHVLIQISVDWLIILIFLTEVCLLACKYTSAGEVLTEIHFDNSLSVICGSW